MAFNAIMMHMNKRSIGTKYEDMAAVYLEQKGMRIVERNFRNRTGEIDLIARDKAFLVFIEVKYRSTEKTGSPMEAISFSKQRNICKVSDYYRMKHGIGEECGIRFDVISICGEEITHIPNAFDYVR